MIQKPNKYLPSEASANEIVLPGREVPEVVVYSHRYRVPDG